MNTGIFILLACATLLAESAVVRRRLVITTVASEPYFRQSRERGPEVCVRNEGYIPDLVSLLAENVGFEYEFRCAADGRYGSIQSDGNWTGMVGELQRGEAEIAAAPLTMTSRRTEVIDWTVPFIAAGLKVVYKRADHENPSFTHLDQFLDSGMPLGVISGGATDGALKTSSLPLYQRLWAAIQRSDETNTPTSYQQAIERVRQGNYAFVMESPSADLYTRSLPCDVSSLDLPGMQRYYGLATQQGSPLRKALSSAILDLQQNGQLDQLYERHWPSQCGN